MMKRRDFLMALVASVVVAGAPLPIGMRVRPRFKEEVRVLIEYNNGKEWVHTSGRMAEELISIIKGFGADAEDMVVTVGKGHWAYNVPFRTRVGYVHG